MFRNCNQFNEFPCPETDCKAPYCQFNHTGVKEWTYGSTSLTYLVEQEISRVRSLPGEPEPDYSTEYVPTNEPEIEPEENQSQTSRDEDNSQDDEDDEEEDNAKAMAEHAKYLKRVKQKKKKQQEQKLEKEKKIEKERKKLEKRKRTDDIFGDEEKMEKKNKKSESHDKLRIVKEKMTTIRAKDIEYTPMKSPERASEPEIELEPVNFSKRKIACDKSEESQALLRPTKQKPKKSDPAMQLIQRLNEPIATKKATPTKSGEYDPLHKRGRVAHTATQANSSKIPLTVVAIPGCVVPSVIRHRQLAGFHTSLAKHVHPKNDNFARQVALEIEMEICKVAKSKANYTNQAANKLVIIRKARLNDPRFAPKHDASKIGSMKRSIGQVLADPKLAASVKKSTKPIINKLNGADLHEALLEYCLTPEQMKLHNYPIPTNESKKVITINDMSRLKSKITGHPTKRICTRCGVTFFVDMEKGTVSGGECNYHGGKLFSDKEGHKYSCCSGGSGSEPCKFNDNHVHEENKADFTGYNGTADFSKIKAIQEDKETPLCYGLDCEMVYTTVGFELVRTTLIDDQLDVVLDAFSLPEGDVLDYNTKYSGVEEKHLLKCNNSLKDIRNMLRAIVSKECILIGHSLESDLCALKLHHPTCVDTSVIYPHKKGLPFKRSLKMLMLENCGAVIQQEDESGAFGHDSAEDARACVKLMLWQKEQDQRAGK